MHRPRKWRIQDFPEVVRQLQRQKATLPGQFTTLQAFNPPKEILSGYVISFVLSILKSWLYFSQTLQGEHSVLTWSENSFKGTMSVNDAVCVSGHR